MHEFHDPGLRWTRRGLLTAAAAGAAAAVVAGRPGAHATEPEDDGTPAGALQRLRDGNRRFVEGRILEPHRDRARIEAIAAKQTPFAAILGCADSRVPVEILFDQGFGDLFVVRVAGNVATPEEIASLEFGTLVLGARALLVLGHTKCGAVEAAMAGKPVPGQISTLFQHIAPGIDRSKADLDAAIEANVRTQVKRLQDGSPVLADLVTSRKLAIQGAVYDLATGAVRELT